MTLPVVRCDYCQRPAVLVKGGVIWPGASKDADYVHKVFWYCAPCEAWVGCHSYNPRHGFDGNEPLGRLAKKDLREAKMKAHLWFDPLWWKEDGRKVPFSSRGDAYAWLAEAMGLPLTECHIGMFNTEQCGKVVQLCKERENKR